MPKSFSQLLAEQFDRLLANGNADTAVSCGLQTASAGVDSSIKILQSSWESKTEKMQEDEEQLASMQLLLPILSQIRNKDILWANEIQLNESLAALNNDLELTFPEHVNIAQVVTWTKNCVQSLEMKIKTQGEVIKSILESAKLLAHNRKQIAKKSVKKYLPGKNKKSEKDHKTKLC